jgi:ATP-dependent exoDNAse (exonuclease V) alpha subunit
MVNRSNISLKQLTLTQQEALDKLKLFIESDRYFFRLSGYAGSGKSFLICHLIKWLQTRELALITAAPTNKAAKNLKQLALTTGIDIEVKTVAQLLGQQPEINEETGLEEFTANNDAQFDDYEVIIIDEFSMINRPNFDAILDAVAMTINTKVIFVGDSAQLPLVKEDSSIVAISEYIDSTLVGFQSLCYS